MQKEALDYFPVSERQRDSIRIDLIRIHRAANFSEFLPTMASFLNKLRMITVMTRHPLNMGRTTRFLVIHAVKHIHIENLFKYVHCTC